MPVDVPGGYTWAGRITTGFDGGNHPLKDDVWACQACGCLILPGNQGTHGQFHARLGTPQSQDAAEDDSPPPAAHQGCGGTLVRVTGAWQCDRCHKLWR